MEIVPQDYYVYELAYPKSMGGAVFYVGMGKGDRINQHERDAKIGVPSYKCNAILQILGQGEKVVKRKVQERISKKAAFAFEIDLIRMYGREHLTNMTNGGEGGSLPLEETKKEKSDFHLSDEDKKAFIQNIKPVEVQETIYKVFPVPDGWFIYLVDCKTGDKLHIASGRSKPYVNRNNAHRRCRQLNETLEQIQIEDKTK